MARDERHMRATRTSAVFLLLLLLYGFSLGMGTNFQGDWYYPIRGISLIDFVILAHFLFMLMSGSLRYPVGALRAETRTLCSLMLFLAGWLLLCTLMNSRRYSLEARDILAVLRLLYFVVIIQFASRLVERHGFLPLLAGYFVGALVMFYQDFSTLTDDNMSKAGIPVLGNPNVVGAQLGLVVYLCSLGVMLGKEKIFLPVALGFSALSITTFSKGTWILVAVGLGANVLALYMGERGGARLRRRVWPYLFAFVGAAVVTLSLYWETVTTILQFKLESTQDLGSFETRQSLLTAGLSAGLEHPLFGLGFGNFYKVIGLYPELPLPDLEREDNAHNLFGQIAAVGGIPALCALLAIMLFGFRLLYCALRDKVAANPFVKLAYVALSAVIFFLFASVQLQLIAQPSFWFYCAVLIGWTHSRWHAAAATECARNAPAAQSL